MDLARVLQQTPIFRDLTLRDLDEIVPHLHERRYDAGQAVLVEGDPAEALYVVAEGALKSHRLRAGPGDAGPRAGDHRRPNDDDGLGGRAAEWLFHCYAVWTGDDDRRHIAWAHNTEDALRPWTMTGMALNFRNDIDDARVRTTFGPSKYQRLVDLKRRWDPDNVFAMNQNISPGG